MHQAPLDGSEEDSAACHLHLHFYPPLLRSATVKKFLVGYVDIIASLSPSLFFLISIFIALTKPNRYIGMSYSQSRSEISLQNLRRTDLENSAGTRFIEKSWRTELG